MAAMTSLTTVMVGTALVEVLGGAPWMIAAMAVLMNIGFGLGPLLVMHRIDGLERFLPAVRRSYVASRLPMLVVSLLLLVEVPAGPTAWAVPIGYAWFGLVHGMGVCAWQQLLARTVALERRAGVRRYAATGT